MREEFLWEHNQKKSILKSKKCARKVWLRQVCRENQQKRLKRKKREWRIAKVRIKVSYLWSLVFLSQCTPKRRIILLTLLTFVVLVCLFLCCSHLENEFKEEKHHHAIIHSMELLISSRAKRLRIHKGGICWSLKRFPHLMPSIIICCLITCFIGGIMFIVF